MIVGLVNDWPSDYTADIYLLKQVKMQWMTLPFAFLFAKQIQTKKKAHGTLLMERCIDIVNAAFGIYKH